jgi:serine/threonine protein kinase
MAPEMIQKKPYDYKIDIWGLGILLFELIQGFAPFRGDTGEEVIAEMKKPLLFSNRFGTHILMKIPCRSISSRRS